MEEKRSKYDTDPLDPDFVRRTGGENDPTRELAPPAPTAETRPKETAEAPTRRYGDQFSSSYPSVFVPPPYQPPATNFGAAGMRPPNPTPPPVLPSHAVAGIGLPEKFAAALPYAPFYIGVVAAAIELYLVPRREVRTRFHAAQGLALQLAIVAIHILFRLLGSFTGSGVGAFFFSLAAFIFLIISMIRVWKGEEHRIMPLSDASRWFNEHIEPRN